MERLTQQVTLPSGIIADILTRWTYDEFLRIEAAEAAIAETLRFVDGSPEANVDASEITNSTKLVLRLAVKKLTAADSSDIPVSDDAIGNLDMDDGIALKRAVDGIKTGIAKK